MTKQSYDSMMSEVEKIISDLQRDKDGSLDAMVANVEKAVELLNQCKSQLTKTSDKLDKLFEGEER